MTSDLGGVKSTVVWDASHRISSSRLRAEDKLNCSALCAEGSPVARGRCWGQNLKTTHLTEEVEWRGRGQCRRQGGKQ